MTDPVDIDAPPVLDQDELDNPLRAILVVNSPDVPEGSMDERMLDSVQTFDEMNEFFDKFDDAIAVPNEGHIKYEVGSDGLVIFVFDNTELKDSALKWIDEYVENLQQSTVDDVSNDGKKVDKRRRVD